MGRHKKNELDTVLEQLKMSYATGFNDDLEDSLLNSEDNEEDAEFSSILEKIFAEGDALKSEETVRENEQDAAQNEEHQVAEVIDKAENSSITQSVTSEIAGCEETEDRSETLNDEEKKVDAILDIMFGGVISEKKNEEADNKPLSSFDDEDSFDSLPSDLDDEILEDEIESGVIEAHEDEGYELDIVFDEIPEADRSYDALDSEADEVETTDMLFDQDAQAEDADIVNAAFISKENDLDGSYGETVLESEIYADDEIALETESYISDQLQQSLDDLSFYKPQADIDFSVMENTIQEEEIVEINKNDPSEAVIDEEDKDISLLMRFGYEGEISENGQSGQANRVAFKQSKEYIPRSYKIKHGFVGKEYTDPAQIPDIKKKYKIDKLILMIKAIVISLITLIVVLNDISFALFKLQNEYSLFTSLLLTVAVIAIFADKIYFGLKSFVRFDSNDYSLPSIVMVEYFILVLSGNIIGFFSAVQNGHIFFGGYAFACIALAVWGEYLDCVREASVFDYISQDRIRYFAEKRVVRSGSQNRYIARQARFLSGYHKKTIENKNSDINQFFVLAILPILAIMSVISNIFISKDPFWGMNSAAYILLFSVPLSGIISMSLINFLDQSKLKKTNAVFIGANACESISNIETLVFEDADVLKVTSYVEIDPENNSEGTKKWINMAYSIFSALGGPLSNALALTSKNDANVDSDIVINSISYNGIDLHFDSSINVLIGDRQYMLSRNIKVKTDINLTGAVKGSERSVIYLAFDKIPRIGFIISSKVKRSFLDAIDLLCDNGIDVEIRSYEPEINEYFFELNDVKHSIPVEKPTVFESREPAEVSDTNIMASTPLELCRAIVYSKHTSEIQKKNKKIIISQTVFGCVFACIMSILTWFPIDPELLVHLKSVSPIILYAVSALMLIPNIIQLIKIIKRKSF